MSTEIQSRPSSLAAVASWFARFSTNGWQENAQIMAVCVVVLLLHLIAAPVLKRAAADPEPGSVSTQEARSFIPAQSSATVSGATTNENAAAQSEKAEKKSTDKLIFTDSKPKAAAPVAQKLPPPVIPSNSESVPEQPASENAASRPVAQAIRDVTAAGKGAEQKAKSNATPGSAAAAVGVPPSLPAQAQKPAAPQLSDLIGGGGSASPPSSATEAATPGEGAPAVKVFRTIPAKP